LGLHKFFFLLTGYPFLLFCRHSLQEKEERERERERVRETMQRPMRKILCALALALVCLSQQSQSGVLAASTPAPPEALEEEVHDQGQDLHDLLALVPSAFFVETFDDQELFQSRWFKSEATKQTSEGLKYQFDGEWKVDEPSVQGNNASTKGLILLSPAKHHAISARITPPIVFHNPVDFVLQYEVKQQETVNCGGSYIKLISSHKTFEPKQFNDQTPYTIMFGPDKCGSNNKVHFIFRHKSPKTEVIEEKHLLRAIPTPGDTRATNLYTLIVRPDNTFSVLVNQEEVSSGSLLEAFEPPVNPPEEIPDPTDLKPEDWVDEAEIPDPEATKPDDWDEDAPQMILDEEAQKPEDWQEDEPLYIPDPSVEKPADWSDEDDGIWEAPQIPNPKCEQVSGCGPWERPFKRNPAYKGKWYPPKIPNPAYKGPFVPRNIPNPDYFYDSEPWKFSPIGAVGFELWTMQANIVFDNILITPSIQEAKAFAEATWAVKNKLEKTSTKDKTEESFLTELIKEVIRQVNGFLLMVFKDPIKAITEFPIASGGILGIPVFILVVIFIIASGSESPRPQTLSSKKASDSQSSHEENKSTNKTQIDSPDEEKSERARKED